MRDYAELVKALWLCGEPTNECPKCPRYGTDDCHGVFREAADAIEELLAAVPEWISVEERLPEDGGYYFAYAKDGDTLRHVTFAKFQPTIKSWLLSGARSYWRVLHWMPLPEPPKEETE